MRIMRTMQRAQNKQGKERLFPPPLLKKRGGKRSVGFCFECLSSSSSSFPPYASPNALTTTPTYKHGERGAHFLSSPLPPPLSFLCCKCNPLASHYSCLLSAMAQRRAAREALSRKRENSQGWWGGCPLILPSPRQTRARAAHLMAEKEAASLGITKVCTLCAMRVFIHTRTYNNGAIAVGFCARCHFTLQCQRASLTTRLSASPLLQEFGSARPLFAQCIFHAFPIPPREEEGDRRRRRS